MKKRSLFKFSGVLFYAFLFCFAPVKNTNAQTTSFGIYETIKLKEISETTIRKLKDAGVQISESVEQPLVGSVQKDFSNNLVDSKVKFLTTIYAIDEKATFFGLVALLKLPSITLKDVSRVEEQNKQVLIHFNLNGAKKWATLTKKNIGSYLAFEINQQIYSLPMVNAEIKKGIAIISEFDNQEIPQKVAKALNSGITK